MWRARNEIKKPADREARDGRRASRDASGETPPLGAARAREKNGLSPRSDPRAPARRAPTPLLAPDRRAATALAALTGPLCADA